ncbi:MAG TPA: endonuclease/exonuclease/phosphatase family protein [Nocardioides sp.]|nr:endonuclease/exonuclease/phosphatase family protein [Nocardioides sp.]
MNRPPAPRHAVPRRRIGRVLGRALVVSALLLGGGGLVAAQRVGDDGVSVAADVDQRPTDQTSPLPRPEVVAPPPRQRVRPGLRLEKAPPPPPPTRALTVRRRAEREARRPVEEVRTASFVVGTLNVLGSNHTPPGSGWAPGRTRIGWAADVVRARGIDVIGLQEVQDDQIPVLASRLPGYTVWPQQALGPSGNRLQIAFRSDLFELAGTGSITTVFSSQMRPVPYVLLRHRESGLTFHVLTLHNSPRELEGERDSATGAEIALFDRLLASGLPLLVTGDTNEPAEFFCRVGAATGMVAANGGSTSGGCVLPPAPTGLDWIMGGGVSGFSDYVRTALPKITDHPIVYSRVALQGTVTE